MTAIEQSALDALKQIRDLGYNSQAHRATDTVLACINIAEENILAIERAHEEQQKTPGQCPTCLSDLCVCTTRPRRKRKAAKV